MRRPIIVANWKMNMTKKDASLFLDYFLKNIGDVKEREVVLCPPFTLLYFVGLRIEGSGILLGAQNLFYKKNGAYTGEISSLMLSDLGCRYVILGHSERRMYFSETDELINKKLKAALSCGLFPILCVGESIEEREAGRAEEVVRTQLLSCLCDIQKESMKHVVIAYEPVWAIGTGRHASPEDANNMHLFIRDTLSCLYDDKTAEGIRIQYGGSVTPGNIDSFMACPQIDGVLVGGASLSADAFLRIVKFEV